MADPMLTSLCAICHVAAPKYRCPRCSLRSCSLGCARRHRAWTSCSGERDATAYVAASRLRTRAGVDHDYNFLHGIETVLARAEREIVEERRLVRADELRPVTVQRVKWRTTTTTTTSGDGFRRQQQQQQQQRRRVLVTTQLRQQEGGMTAGGLLLVKKLRKLNIRILRAPDGFSRHRKNMTTLNRRTARINWQVEWLVVGDDEAVATTTETKTETRRYLAKVMDDVPVHEAYRLMVDEQQRKAAAVANSKKTTPATAITYLGACPQSRCLPAAAPMQDPHTGLWFVVCANSSGGVGGSSLAQWPRERQDEYRYFLAQPQTRRPDQRVVVTPLATTDCLRDVLPNTKVLEFPTLVALPACMHLPDRYVLGPKDVVAPLEAVAGIEGKRKDGPGAGYGRAAAKRYKTDDDDDDDDDEMEEGQVDEEDGGEEDGDEEDGDDESDGELDGLVQETIIEERCIDEDELGEDDDDDDDDDSTSDSDTSSESDSE